MNIGGENDFGDYSMLAIMLGCLMEEKSDDETENLIEKLVLKKLAEGATGNATIEDDGCNKMLVNPMWIAIERGWVDLIKKMIANGFDFKRSYMPCTEISTLYYAVKCCQYKAVKCLLEAGVDVNDHPSAEAGGVYHAPENSILAQAIYSVEYYDADEKMIEIVLDYGGKLNPDDPEKVRREIFKFAKRRIATIAINLAHYDLPVLLVQEICQQIMGPRFFPQNLTISWNIIKLIKEQSKLILNTE